MGLFPEIMNCDCYVLVTAEEKKRSELTDCSDYWPSRVRVQSNQHAIGVGTLPGTPSENGTVNTITSSPPPLAHAKA